MIDIAAELQTEVASALVRLRGLAETETMRDWGAGKWVKKEILGHLIDSASNNHQRFVRAQFGDPFVWPRSEQEEGVSLHGYR